MEAPITQAGHRLRGVRCSCVSLLVPALAGFGWRGGFCGVVGSALSTCSGVNETEELIATCT